MKTYIYLTILFIAGGISPLYSQCAYNNTIYLTGPAPTVVGNSILGPDTWGGEFNRVTGMQAGNTYEISTCGDPTFDSELTIFPAGGGTAVAYDDDGCGITGGASKIMFTPTASGDYDIQLNQYSCASNQIDMDMTITLISIGGTTPGVTIPVVVHVIYKNPTENISDQQIQSQLTVLNDDFRKTNVDFNITPSVFQPLGADMDITFCLASFDPSGNPTTGITRTSTTVQSFDHTAEPKFTSTGGHDNWDPTRYLNLWVCDLTGNLLGYATFPSDLASDPQLDGVVIDYQYLGTINATPPFNLGRTATHEIGHWLNLRHIWGDAQCGDDFVADTPTQNSPSSGCPTFPQVSCGNGPNGDLFYNFMDYSDDACLVLFTNGQKQRTGATLSTVRNQLATSTGCGVAGIAETHDLSFELYPNPAKGLVTLNIPSMPERTVVKFYNMLGKEVNQYVLNYGTNQIDVKNLEKGIYIVELSATGSKGIKKLIIQ